MDASIRFYNPEGRLRSTVETETRSHASSSLQEEDDSRVEASVEEDERVTDTIASQNAHTLEEPAQPVDAVDIADFEAIFLRYQGPISNYIYHLIGNREQAYDLAQDVFVKAYKALLNGTVVQPGALSAWLYRIAANTTTDSLRRRRLIAWLPLSLFNEDRGIGAGVPSDAGSTSSENFSANGDDGDGHSSSVSSLYERNGYDGGLFENRVADREIVERIFRQLPPKYSSCLWLYEHDGRSCAEIAQALNISASAVKMRLMRARERFVALYRQEMGDL
jgi:RNA polymerase sigma-70 factor (ECF subfamily)